MIAFVTFNRRLIHNEPTFVFFYYNKDGSAELNSENGNSAKTNGSNGTVSIGN